MQTLYAVKSDLDLLAQVLDRPAKIGKVLCPFHSDHDPSLSIKRWPNDILTFKCFACGASGTVIEAYSRLNGCTINEACLKLAGTMGAPKRRKPYQRIKRVISTDPVVEPDPVAFRVKSIMALIREELDAPHREFEDRLIRRGISITAAREFSVAHFGTIHFKDRDGKETTEDDAWLFPLLNEENKPVALKLHREDSENKSAFLPVGAWKKDVGKRVHGYAAFFPAPEHYDNDGLPNNVSDWPQLWLNQFEARRDGSIEGDETAEYECRCLAKRQNPTRTTDWIYLLPGELKALAMRSAGFKAISISTGENWKWARAHVNRLRGRRLCIVYDDDPKGKEFNADTIAALAAHCAELKSITFGRGARAKIDANDIAARDGSAGLRNRICADLEAAPNLAVAPFDIEAHALDVEAEIEEAMERNNGVSLFDSVVGSKKSTAVRNILTRRKDLRAAIFVSDHRLGSEYEKLGDCIRLISPMQMSKEGRGPDANSECPDKGRVEALSKNNLPYANRICGSCPWKDECIAFQQKQKASEARILILQYSHLKIAENLGELLKDRIIIIDECPLGKALCWLEKFSLKQLEQFECLVSQFSGTEDHGASFRSSLTTLRMVVDRTRKIKTGASLSFGDAIYRMQRDDAFSKAWNAFLSREAHSKNLTPIFEYLTARGTWLRRVQKNDDIYFITSRSSIPDAKAIIILDATKNLAAYNGVFAGRQLNIWPNAPLPLPVSDVVQMVDATYPKQSLIDTTGATPQPSECFKGICKHIATAVKFGRIEWKDVGIVTLKALKDLGAFAAHLPGVNPNQILHYANCRGLNNLADCRLVCLIGIQQPSSWDLAETAIALNNLDVDPGELERNSGRGVKAFEIVGEAGREWSVENMVYEDERMMAARDLTSISELVQAIGRARPYKRRTARQTVLVFTNTVLPCPISRAMTRAEHLTEIGATAGAMGRIRAAMAKLAAQGEFGKAELAKEMGVELLTLRSEYYRNLIAKCCYLEHLRFKTNGPKDGVFTKTATFAKTKVNEDNGLQDQKACLSTDPINILIEPVLKQAFAGSKSKPKQRSSAGIADVGRVGLEMLRLAKGIVIDSAAYLPVKRNKIKLTSDLKACIRGLSLN